MSNIKHLDIPCSVLDIGHLLTCLVANFVAKLGYFMHKSLGSIGHFISSHILALLLTIKKSDTSMIQQIKIASRFLKFYSRAKTKFNVHSPFVFEFINAILEDDRAFYAFREVEILRGELLASKESVEVLDLGAGSHTSGIKKQRRVRDIAKSALSPAYQCEWLFRIANLYKPLTVIELGTSLGVSTLYMAEGTPNETTIFTLEGAPEIARLAQRNFEWFFDTFEKRGLIRYNLDLMGFSKFEQNIGNSPKKKKIKIVEGNFDQTLHQTLHQTLQSTQNQSLTVDLAFIDGNHRAEPTLAYFEKILPHTNTQSILIFDDIHWSEDMEKAWETIKNHPSVRLTIDLFWCGIVFFRHENKEKEHFSLIKHRWKPFSHGLFG